jgi:predicted RNase H-like nuclease (RuvC/YqgF family)
MDIDRLEALEKYVANLVDAFVHLKEENKNLNQRIGHLQYSVNVQKQQLERLQPERDELLQFRTMIQSLQREREIIRKKLEEMLTTIERLEGFSQTDGKFGG